MRGEVILSPTIHQTCKRLQHKGTTDHTPYGEKRWAACTGKGLLCMVRFAFLCSGLSANLTSSGRLCPSNKYPWRVCRGTMRSGSVCGCVSVHKKNLRCTCFRFFGEDFGSSRPVFVCCETQRFLHTTHYYIQGAFSHSTRTPRAQRAQRQ